jgi:5,10-methylene-tetrahydrofolate dehydrogenase/methenyl tetrahydrofolate cyclohydrolase
LLAALMRLSIEAQMFLPLRRPARHKIINHARLIGRPVVALLNNDGNIVARSE